MIEAQYTAEQVFSSWKTWVEKELGKARYTKQERLEQLDTLCAMFKDSRIEYEDALMLKKDFVDFVVTREGKKGKGNHKGWKENAAENFEGILFGYYSGQYKTLSEIESGEKKKKIKKNVDAYDQPGYLPRTPLLVAWTKHKFKDRWSEAICLEAHKIGGAVNILFQKEVLASDWSNKNNNLPSWYRKVC